MNDRALVPSTDYQTIIDALGERAKRASQIMASAPTAAKNKALRIAAQLLDSQAKRSKKLIPSTFNAPLRQALTKQRSTGLS